MPAVKLAKQNRRRDRKAAKPDFAAVFAALRQLLESFRGNLAVQTDKPGNYHLEAPSILHRGKPLYFAGVRTNKNYVSFHLLHMYYESRGNESAVPGAQEAHAGQGVLQLHCCR